MLALARGLIHHPSRWHFHAPSPPAGGYYNANGMDRDWIPALFLSAQAFLY